jgi:hypothetical protein
MVKATDFMPKKISIMDPADDPNAGLDKEFRQETMFNQLGKVLDSRGNPNPITHVTTDDGEKHPITAQQAKALRALATAENVKPPAKLQFAKDIQTSQGIKKFLSQPDTKNYVSTFVDTYMKGQTVYTPTTKY